MRNPPPKGQAILDIIVREIKNSRFDVKRPETFLGYKQVHDELNLQLPRGMTYGEHLQEEGLEDLALWTIDEGHPGVTGLIVDQQKYRPGPGYFAVFGRATDERDWWLEQVAASLRYRWDAYLRFGEPPSPEPTPKAKDFEPPERVETTTYRVLRDTVKAILVKMAHQHKCQLCGTRLNLKEEGWYSEAHHIKPLGRPHDGPDDISNIMCVCPNCHALLDHGAIPLDIATLPQIGHHTVAKQYVDYHNRVIFQDGTQDSSPPEGGPATTS
jgi:hypothetical protein